MEEYLDELIRNDLSELLDLSSNSKNIENNLLNETIKNGDNSKNIWENIFDSVEAENNGLATNLDFFDCNYNEEITNLQNEFTYENEIKSKSFLQNQDSNLNETYYLNDLHNEELEVESNDTFNEYQPKKYLKGLKHPDIVVETNSMAAIEPPDIYYKLKIPESIIENRHLSNLQLEAIIYACQRFEQFLPNKYRAGFLLGDGPGVGKGRTIAGIIHECFLNGFKKAVWLSVSNDLKLDAQRDLSDVCLNIPLQSFNKFKYNEKICFDGRDNSGVLFSTYSTLIGEIQSNYTTNNNSFQWNSMASYNTVSYSSRIDQLIDWIGADFEGLIIFDECHKAKNLITTGGSGKSTKTAAAVVQLQNLLPKARVLYCSATGASELRNMAYMNRLGLWGPETSFNDFSDFLGAMEKHGVVALEMVAMEMKQRGMYLARQLSYYGTTFSIKNVSLNNYFKETYNQSVDLWIKIKNYFDYAMETANIDQRQRKNICSQIWLAHQRFFKYLCIAAKVRATVDLSLEALKNNMCVVIGLQSTGEAKTMEMLEENGYINEFVSTIKEVVSSLIEKYFPRDKTTTVSSEIKNKFNKRVIPDNVSISNEALDAAGIKSKKFSWMNNINNVQSNKSKMKNLTCNEMYDELMEDLQRLSPRLPINSLDDLIESLGGPSAVAEMTGRRGRITLSNGTIKYESRTTDDVPTDAINIVEKRCFMNGEKLIAVISEAASSGISLHADKRALNTRKRLHITLELPWSADKAIQQFGRSHRSNQLWAPEYVFMISELSGEMRFASVVAKRLESMGALTHGDRHAADSRDMNQFNFDTKYGRMALNIVIKSLNNLMKPIVKVSGNYEALSEMKLALSSIGFLSNDTPKTNNENDNASIIKFLNRILGLHVDMQNSVFQYFSDTLDELIRDSKLNGSYDNGILEWGRNDENVRVICRKRFDHNISHVKAFCEIITFKMDRGLTWEEALKLLSNKNHSLEGFYITRESKNGRHAVVLIKSASLITSNRVRSENPSTYFFVWKPNTGKSSRCENIDDINKKYIIATREEACPIWIEQYISSQNSCFHQYWWNHCKIKDKQGSCDVGLRIKSIHLLCGSILYCWSLIDSSLGNAIIRMAKN